jgi:hypothetical protein
MNAHVPLAAFSATMKARLRKEPGLYFDNIATSTSMVSGAFPSARLLTSAYARCPAPILFSQSGRSLAEWQGGVIMTNLRALVGAGFLLAVIVFVVSVPLVWALIIGIGEAYPAKINKDLTYQQKVELVLKKILPLTMYEQIRGKNEVKQK